MLTAGAAAAPIDLSGTWSYALTGETAGSDTMGVVSITQTGAAVAGRWLEVEPQKEQKFGFRAGEELLEATVDGTRLRGRIRLHYGVANRDACPAQWQTWGAIDIALPETPDRLEGKFRASEITPKDCSVREIGWQSFALVRQSPLPAPAQGQTTLVQGPTTLIEGQSTLIEGQTELITSEASDVVEAEPAVAGTPDRIDLTVDQVSASPGQGLTLHVLLRSGDGRRVTADKLYRISLSAEDAEVEPEAVEIPQGGSAAAARVIGERPGEVPIRAVSQEGDLREGRATVITCGSNAITRIVLNAESEESRVGIPVKATLSMQDDNGVEVSGAAGKKRIRVEVKGVGRFASPGRDVIEEGRCATELLIAADRPGKSPVTVSLAQLAPEERTFRFVLPATHLAAVLALGGLLGGLARSGQTWRYSKRWKLDRWSVTMLLSLVAGIAVYLIYSLGLVELLPVLPLGYEPALLLSLVGGYLGPTALERVSGRILPG